MHNNEFSKLFSLNNILDAWQKFSSGKTNKEEIMKFWHKLEENIFEIHKDLLTRSYQHCQYEKFTVQDPKKRTIHKASARDRVVHQIVHDYLGDIFEKRFIFDSFSSRPGKGTHRAVKRLRYFSRKIYHKNFQNCWALKCDIYKYFDSIDHKILFDLISRQIINKDILGLVKLIISSYHTMPGKGLPLGNLTSQLFANVYLHELDYYVKHVMKIKYYIRFNDDFIIIDQSRNKLETIKVDLQRFLKVKLSLFLPEDKTEIRNLKWGIDFLGYIILPQGTLIRTKTRRRMIANIINKRNKYSSGKLCYNEFQQIICSYLGALKHCSSFRLRQTIYSIIQNQ